MAATFGFDAAPAAGGASAAGFGLGANAGTGALGEFLAVSRGMS